MSQVNASNCTTALALTFDEDNEGDPNQSHAPRAKTSNSVPLALTFDEVTVGGPNQSHVRSPHQTVALTLTFDEDNEGGPDQSGGSLIHQTVHLWHRHRPLMKSL